MGHSTRPRRSIVASAIAVALLTACTDESRKRGSPVASGDAAAPTEICASLDGDAAGLAAGEPVSFAESVMPVLGLSCNSQSCHLGSGGGSFPRFGPECAYDRNTAECLFEPGALSDAVLDGVYSALLAPSAGAPSLSRIEPGDVLGSFLVLKISDCQDALPELVCRSCGTEMPPSFALRASSPERYELIVRWVAQGAPR